jgi:ABC-type transport system substrate-binding protein
MTRTPFGRRGTAALCVAMLSAIVACSSVGGGGAPAGEAAGTEAANWGTLTVGLLREPTSFLASGVTESMSNSYAVDAPIAEGLLWYRSMDETRKASTLADFWRPALATEVPATLNGDVRTSGCSKVTFGGEDRVPKMCVVWKLRRGVRWHDGSVFSSKDVCDTFRFFWLRYQDHNPTRIPSTTGWQETIGCDDGNL